MRAVLPFLVVSLLSLAPAGAQTVLPKHDAIVSIGWAGSEYEISDFDNWRASLLVDVSGGFYWTEHLKTEIAAAWSSPGSSQFYEEIRQSPGPVYAASHFRSRDIRLGAAQIYQFGHNQWVHPYIGVGMDGIARTTTKERAQQTRSVSVGRGIENVVVPASSTRERRTLAQPFVKTGMKLYVSDRGFFNTELKIGFTSGVEHMVWKLGYGLDF